MQTLSKRLNKNVLFILIGIALMIKLSLFLFAEANAPDAKFMWDTQWYLKSGMNFIEHGAFARSIGVNVIQYEVFRTPGYPFFLGLTHDLLNLPFSGVVLIQVLLGVLTAWFVYCTARLINLDNAWLAGLIMLYDPSMTVHALFLLTDCLFTCLLSVFLYCFVKFVQKKNLRDLILSSLLLVCAIYVRPVAYYLPGFLVFFLLFNNFKASWKRNIIYALAFLITCYSLIGLWHLRNHARVNRFVFSDINSAALKYEGILSKGERYRKDAKSEHLESYHYYLNVIPRSVWELWTRPASLKNLGSQPLKLAGKIFAYPFILFWMIGLVRGIWAARGSPAVVSMVVVIGYLTVVTVLAILLNVGPRFRLPMMPFVAVISAYGWGRIAYSTDAVE